MSNMNHQEYDAIIIGGGITGAGVARDCALRGLKVLLVEKQDLLTEPQDETTVFCIVVHAMQ